MNEELPPPTAWITVVETAQGPSRQVNWTKMRGVEHHPLFTADDIRTAVLAEREALSSLLAKCAQIAEWHLGDTDDCGVLAREVFAAIRGND